MEAHVKQRVIGVLVLIAIGAIFLPVLFHNARPVTQIQLPLKAPAAPASLAHPLLVPNPVAPKAPANVQNPPSDFIKPAVKQNAVTKQAHLSANGGASNAQADHPEVSVAKQPANSPAVAKAVPAKVAAKVAQKAAVKPISLAKALAAPQAWVVQLASFSNERNAQQLLHKLRSQGFDAYQRQSGRFIKVFVGPQISQDKIHALQEQLQHKLGLKGIVRQYQS